MGKNDDQRDDLSTLASPVWIHQCASCSKIEQDGELRGGKFICWACVDDMPMSPRFTRTVTEFFRKNTNLRRCVICDEIDERDGDLRGYKFTCLACVGKREETPALHEEFKELVDVGCDPPPKPPKIHLSSVYERFLAAVRKT